MYGLKRQDLQAGVATAELSVVLPLLLVGIVGLTDFGRAAMESITIANAAHAGAKYGSHSPGHMGDTLGIRSAVEAELQDLGDTSSIVVETEKYCNCPDGAVVDCDDGVCGIDATGRRTYIRVRVEKLFSTVIKYPGVPELITLKREAHVRAR
ncbi:MAG: TadE/TadG family type IV pilus assembly protein [Candidatus Binatia bacterium]